MDTPHNNRELILLEHIEHDPDVTQASLAVQLGVAVGGKRIELIDFFLEIFDITLQAAQPGGYLLDHGFQIGL